MSSEVTWTRRTLQQAGVSLIDCDHRTPAAAGEGFPYIAIPQLKDGHVDLNGVRRIAAADYVEWTKKLKPCANDVIVVRRCNSGDSALVPVGLDCAIGQNLVVLRSNGAAIEPTFLRWLVRGPDWWDQVAKFINVGAVFDSLRCRDIPNFELTVPPMSDQRAIAALLNDIDARITLLRETNATLESIAQTLFKSWFVDFDPVRAKQQGLAPAGMDEATAALFPDSFEESALRLIPKGWRPGTVGDFVHMHRGSVNPGSRDDTMFEHFSLPAFDAGQTPIRELGTEIKSNKTPVPRDAVLLSKLNPHIPRVWLPVDVGPHAVCSTEFLVFLPTAGASREFAYCSFVAAPFQERLRQLVTGTSNSHQRVKPDGVLSLSAVVPAGEVLDAFTFVVRPLFQRIGHSRRQAQTLATLRDTLLPRLISGRLRLPEAEAQGADNVPRSS